VLASAGKLGTRVIIPYRDEDGARIFKPMGDLGQIVRMVCLANARNVHLELTLMH